MGTRFMATKEAPIHDKIKQALVDGDERSTTLVMRTLKNTERVYKNKAALEVRDREEKTPGSFEAIRPFMSGTLYKEAFQVTGDTDNSIWSCGTVMGLIEDIPTCKELIERMVIEAEDIIRKRLSSMVVSKL